MAEARVADGVPSAAELLAKKLRRLGCTAEVGARHAFVSSTCPLHAGKDCAGTATFTGAGAVEWECDRGGNTADFQAHFENGSAARVPGEDDGAAQVKRSVAPVWAEDFLAEKFLPLRWLLAPVLPAESVAVIFSAPNIGKTLWSMDAVCQVTKAGGSCLAIETEGGKRAFQKRLDRAIAAAGGLPPRRLKVLHHVGLELLRERHEEVITSWAKGCELTMLDSLAALTPGVDENDAAVMTSVGAVLNRMRASSGGTVLAVAHSGKIAWKPGETPSLAHLRGHGALAATVDTALALVPAEADEGMVSFDLHVVKQRDEERAKPRRYTIAMRGEAAIVEVEELGQARAGSERMEEAKARVLKVVPAFPGTASANQVCRVAGGSRPHNLEAIRELEEKGIIRSVGFGKLQRVTE